MVLVTMRGLPLADVAARLEEGARECCCAPHADTTRAAAEWLRAWEQERAALRAEVWRLQNAIVAAEYAP
jgi:hypothetical protein